MFPIVQSILFILRLVCPHLDRELEILALRQQLAIYKRQLKRPKLKNADRRFWILLKQAWPDWKSTLLIVSPETVIRWHRRGFRYYWKWKCRKKGRPSKNIEVRRLIQKLSKENPTWGIPRIQKELGMLGFHAAQDTIRKYRFRNPVPPEKAQSWKTFLKSHLNCTIAADMFTVPTATFKLLYVFVLLSHDKRKILFTNCTYQPNDAWLAQQLRNAFFDERPAKHLLTDRNSNYGDSFKGILSTMDMEWMRTSPRSPWQNPYCERVIGTIRRECLDHMIIFGPGHLRKILREYEAYYNRWRPHGSLDDDSPLGRTVEVEGDIISQPWLGGLHHVYRRAA